eukprot:UN27683
MYDKAIDLYKYGQKSNMKFNIVQYNALLESYSSLNILPEIMKELQQENIELDEESYAELIRLCQQNKISLKP